MTHTIQPRKASAIALERCQDIARIITLAMGEPIAEAVGKVEKIALALRYHVEEGERI